MEPRFCRSCGTAFGEQDRFCGSCGLARPLSNEAGTAPQSARQEPVKETPAVAPSPAMQSVVAPAPTDSMIVILSLVSAVGFAALWAMRLLSIAFDMPGFKAALATVLTSVLLAPVGLGLSATVALACKVFLEGRREEQRVLFVALGSLSLGVIRLGSFVSLPSSVRPSQTWSLYVWSDLPFELYPPHVKWLAVLSTVAAMAGLASFAIFVITRRLWTLVPSIKPGGQAIAAVVVLWFVWNRDLASRFSGAQGVLLLGALLGAVVCLLLLIPGDFGTTVAVFLGGAHVVFAAGAFVGQVVFVVLGGDTWYLSWSSVFLQVIRSALLAAVCFRILQSRGGAAFHARRVRALALG